MRVTVVVSGQLPAARAALHGTGASLSNGLTPTPPPRGPLAGGFSAPEKIKYGGGNEFCFLKNIGGKRVKVGETYAKTCCRARVYVRVGARVFVCVYKCADASARWSHGTRPEQTRALRDGRTQQQHCAAAAAASSSLNRWRRRRRQESGGAARAGFAGRRSRRAAADQSGRGRGSPSPPLPRGPISAADLSIDLPRPPRAGVT